jgi:hypothetical protein
MRVYGVSAWEASKPLGYDKRKRKPIRCAELTPELLAKLKRRIPRWKPDAEWSYVVGPVPEPAKGRKPVVLDNADLVQLFDGVIFSMRDCTLPTSFEDIFYGVVRLDMHGNTRPLSMMVVYRLLSKLERLSTDIIADALGLSDRQSRKYMQACGLVQLLVRREVVKREMYNQELIEQSDQEIITTLEEERIEDD